MTEDFLSSFLSESAIGWFALSGAGLFILFVLLKKYGII